MIGIVALLATLMACGDDTAAPGSNDGSAAGPPLDGAPGRADGAGADASVIGEAGSVDGGRDQRPPSSPDVLATDARDAPSGSEDTPPPAPAIDSGSAAALGTPTSCGFLGVGGESVFELPPLPSEALRRENDRVLAIATNGAWALWNTTTGLPVRFGTGASATSDLRGGLFVVRAGAGPHEILRASDGQAVARIPEGNYKTVALSSDGSYVWGASSAELVAWNVDGTVRFRRAGDYGAAVVFASPAELAVANGPAGADRIELLAATDGARTLGAPYVGIFYRWFEDGQRFLAVSGGGIQRVHSKAGVQEGIYTFSVVQAMGGFGKFVWVWDGANIRLYRVGGDNAEVPGVSLVDGRYGPRAMGPLLVGGRIPPPINSTDRPSLMIVRLDGAEPTTTSVPVDFAQIAAYGADPSGRWAVLGDGIRIGEGAAPSGVLGCGALLGLAGAGPGGTSLAVGLSRRLERLDVSAAPRQLGGPVLQGINPAALSEDGRRLAYIGFSRSAQTAFVIDLETSANLLDVLPYDRVTISPRGSLVAAWSAINTAIDLRVFKLPGTTPVRSGDERGRALLSPDGTRFSTSSGGGATRLYDSDGKLVNILAGTARFWTYENQLVVLQDGKYQIKDRDGNDMGETQLSFLKAVSSDGRDGSIYLAAAGGRMYRPATGELFQVAPGALVGTLPPDGLVVGSRLIYVDGTRVRSRALP
jgi:hypothetical protein